MEKIRVGTRQSQLALWQAYHFQKTMASAAIPVEVEIIKVVTSGDQFLKAALDEKASQETGVAKGFFTKELEEKLLSEEIDVAIHSLKDLPTNLPLGLSLGAISEREQVADLLLAMSPIPALPGSLQQSLPDIQALPKAENGQVIVGTASQRRQAQLGELYRKLPISLLRGNVNTRLRKLIENQYSAILLAEAGIRRILDDLNQNPDEVFSQGCSGFFPWQDKRIYYYRMPVEVFIPACAQGFLGVELRSDDQRVQKLIQQFASLRPSLLAILERSFLRTLEAGCHAPVAVYAHFINDDQVQVLGKVLSKSGDQVIFKETTVSFLGNQQMTFDDHLYQKYTEFANQQGIEFAQQFLQAGAQKLLS